MAGSITCCLPRLHNSRKVKQTANQHLNPGIPRQYHGIPKGILITMSNTYPTHISAIFFYFLFPCWASWCFSENTNNKDLALFFFKSTLVFFFLNSLSARQKEKECQLAFKTISFCWVTSHISTIIRDGSSWSQELRTQSRVPTCVARIQWTKLSYHCCLPDSVSAGSWTQVWKLHTPSWDVGGSTSRANSCSSCIVLLLPFWHGKQLFCAVILAWDLDGVSSLVSRITKWLSVSHSPPFPIIVVLIH